MTMSCVVEFNRYTSVAARAMRSAVEDVYRRSYVDAIASGDPFDSPEAFMGRFDAYTTDPGFVMVVAYAGGNPVGQTWGWPLSPQSHWWDGLKLDGTVDYGEFVAEDGMRTFALSEIMVRTDCADHGIARKLQGRILGTRPERRATLLVEEGNLRAYSAYLRWGWWRVGVLQPSWPNAPLFDALVRDL